MSWHQETLAALDRTGYVVLEAIHYGGVAPRSTFARPSTFVCIDGNTYWVKNTAQQGLVAELIAGRLGDKVGASPVARIIRVSREALPPTGEASHLEGLVVGTQDIPGSVNARDLEPFIRDGTFQPGLVDPISRARVVAFQTWLGVGDAQVLLSLTDGAIFSIDHGDCFGTVGTRSDPAITVTSIPGVPNLVGKDVSSVEAAVRRIESISDRDILEAVTRIPAGGPWRSPVDRRAEIGHWLADRRGRMREVMEQWLRT